MGKPKSVLLVDDDETTNFLNQFFVAQVDTSLEVGVAHNGKEAIAYLQHQPKEEILPCLLLLDTNMPVMDGWEFLDEFDKRFNSTFKKQVVIVMFTSFNVEQATKKALNDPNVTDTALKPLSDLKFRAILEKHF